MKIKHVWAITLSIAIVAVCFVTAAESAGKTAGEIDGQVDQALKDLYAQVPAAKELSTVSKGILVFPEVVKGGLIVGGQYGEGALIKNGKKSAYYSTAAASYGLQAGLQKFGYVMFFMTEDALAYLDKSAGWEVGAGPSIVVMDEGTAKSMTTSSLQDDIYVFFFSQKGLMAGLGLQGSKITRITPDKKQ